MLANFYWILPEVFLATVSTVMLGYGCVLVKFGKKIQQLKKLHIMVIVSLLITSLLLIEQLGWTTESTIYVANGYLTSNEYITAIKLVLVLSSALILVLSLEATIMDKILDYEFSQLVLLSTLGMMLLISSNDLIMLYLAVELLSLAFYVLAAIKRESQHATEAALKYFLLGALSSGLLLFGMGLVYAFTGETGFDALANILWYDTVDTEVTVGATFILIALLFKVAAAPFHQWVVDTYEGAPTIVTAFFAIVPKIATLGVIITLLSGPFLALFDQLQPLIAFTAVLSLLIGSIGALNQAKMKRLLAYSAITHIGFLLIGVLPNTLLSLNAAFVYIFLYIIMSFNTFTFVLGTFKHGNFITQLSGLSRYNPVLAMTFAFTLLSIAGVPPLAGFYSKYLILLQAINEGFYVVAFIAIMASCVASFYYLRIIKWMFFKDTQFFHMKDIGDCIYPVNTSLHVSFTQSIILGATTFIILTFLFYPAPFVTFSMNILLTSLV
jgi:NADH-quinone oxidoreductase subunit N